MTVLHVSTDLDLPIDAVTGTFGILATKGAGKSNAAVVMAEEMYDAGVPWVAVDPKGDWWGIRSSGDGKGPGLPIVVFGGRHGDVPLEPTAGHLIADLVLAQRLTCVLDVSQFTKADTVRFLTAFGDRLFRHADDDGAEPLHLFLEEAHEYLPQQVPGPLAQMVSVWQRIVKQGRFKGLGCTLISQRSSSLNKDVLELVDTLIVLRTIGPRSRDAIKAWVKDQDVDEKLLASLPSLASGEAWMWSPGELQIMQRIHFRRRRTFDSGATPKVGQARRAPATLADVDLAAIKEQMADTIEKAKADDPAELRKQLAEARRELASAINRQSEPVVEVQVERVEVPVLSDEVVARLEAVGEQVWPLSAALRDALAAAGDLRDGRFDAHETRTLQRTPPRTRTASTSPEPQVTAPRRADIGEDSTLPEGERRVLTAIAQHVDGVSREQLSILTAYKRSTRDKYLQLLNGRGYVHVTGKTIIATDAGVDALGSAFEPLPVGAALREHWLRELPEGEARILRELVDAYPDGVTRDELSEHTGYKRSTRDKYLQLLRARHLITVSDGAPRAADMLFS